MALFCLFQYAEEEARRLGLTEAADQVEILASSCLCEAKSKFGMDVFEEGSCGQASPKPN